MKNTDKVTEVPGVDPAQAVNGARLAHEDSAFDEWFHDVMNGAPGQPIRNDSPAKE